MREDRHVFVQRREARWREFDALLRRGPSTGSEWTTLASSYRSICSDLSRARSLHLPSDILHHLDDLAARAHNQLYGSRQRQSLGLIHTIAVEFPRELREQKVFFILANLLFYGPFFVGGLLAIINPDSASLLMSEGQLAQVESMYSDSIGRGNAGSDASMAGFYVFNNVGIAFRCFATGAFGGLGSLFYLIYNGTVLGTMIGYVIGVGLGQNILEFVCGHAAWELTGIVVSGAAGLRMGWALVVTEGRTIASSLAAAGPSLYRLIMGAAFMLFMAAAIEGFWSASPIPIVIKAVFAVIQVTIVTSWLIFGGRST